MDGLQTILGKVAQKEYTKNTNETIEVMDIAGNKTNINILIDNIKVEEQNTNDNTIKPGDLPGTGLKQILIISIVILSIFAVVVFIRYKNMLK